MRNLQLIVVCDRDIFFIYLLFSFSQTLRFFLFASHSLASDTVVRLFYCTS